MGKKTDKDRERDRERKKRARSREKTKNDVEKPTESRDRPAGAGRTAKEDGWEIRDEDTPGHRRVRNVARGKCI